MQRQQLILALDFLNQTLRQMVFTGDDGSLPTTDAASQTHDYNWY